MAGTIKGMTIEIGGNTAPLEQALKDTNKEIKATQKELNEVNKLLKLDPTNTTLIKQKQELLGQQIGQTTTKLEALKKAQQQVDEVMKQGGNVNQAEYRELQRQIALTESSLGKLKDEAKNTNPQLAKLKEGLQKAGEVASTVAKTGFNLTVTGIKAMGTACLGAITGVTTLAVKSGSLADDLNTLASKTGLSTKKLQEFQYASDLIDVSVDTLSGALKKTTSAISSAQDGTGTSAEAFKKLGVNIKNADGSLRDNSDVFNDSIKALGNIANETERDALAMQLFGKSATELNPLIEGGVDVLAKMSKQANDLGLILSQEALDGANAFNDELDILKANGKGLFNVIGTEVASQLVPAMESLNSYTMGAIKSLTSAMETGGLEGLVQEISNQLGQLIAKAVEKLPEIAKFGVNIIKTLLDAIKQNASSIGSAGAELISVLVEAFFTSLPDIIQIAITLLTSFAQTLAEQFPTLFPIVLNGLIDILHVIIDNLPLIVDTIMTVIETIVFTLTEPDNLDMIIDASITLMIALIEGLIKAIPRIVERLPEIIMAIVNGLIHLAEKLWEVGKPLLIALGQGIVNALATLGEYVIGVWDYIKTTLTNAFKGVVNIGKNLIEGLWNGIKGAKDWLINKIKSLCSDALRSNQELLWN